MTVGGVWAIAPYHDPVGHRQFAMWPMSEFDKEVHSAQRRLRSLNFGTGDVILVVASVDEAAHFAPLQRAARELGGTSCLAEASPLDAHRIAAYLDIFAVRATIGIDSATMAALLQLSGGADLLGTCSTHVVREDVAEGLTPGTSPPLRMRKLGPALGMECLHRQGLHVGRDVWQVEAEAMAQLRPAADSLLDIEPFPLPEGVAVVTDRCGCGSDDPRLVFRS